jgi:serralysin
MCIKCGYYLKDYDHSGDLSDDLSQSVLGTNEDLANYLSSGFWEDYGTVPRKFNLSKNGINPKNGVITYNTSSNSFDNNGINKDREFLVDEAFKILEVSMGFNFQKTSQKADINFGDKYINSAFAYADGRSYSLGLDFVNINIGSNWNRGENSLGDYTFQTILHEIGHSLGLGHQGSYNGSGNYSDDSIFINDSWQSSIMSYFSQIQNTSTNASFAYLSTYMSADWNALDNIYSSEGFSTANAFAGDTTYGFNTNIIQSKSVIYSEMSNWISNNAYTLVDGSGIDTVDFSGFSSDQLIDLRETDPNSNNLYASNIGGKIGNLTIASGTIIENVNGGKGSDLINGNSSDNQIFGNDGNDVINSGKGNDIIDGGAGDDLINSGKGNDIIDGGAGDDFIFGGEGDKTITFGSGEDVIDYSSFDNSITLIRGGSVDKGLLGTDTFVDFYEKIYASNNNSDWIDGLSGGGNIASLNVDLKNNSLNVFNLPGIGEFNSEIYNFENISGSNMNDNLFGDNKDNQIFGNDGNDVINSGKGNDIIDGGSGYDIAIFSSIKSDYFITETNDKKYKISANKGNDTDIFENIEVLRFTDQDFDVSRLMSSKNTTEEPLIFSGTNKFDFLNERKSKDQTSGSTADKIYGGSEEDILYGGSGKDFLKGGSSADKLYGGSGEDTLYGGSGKDYLYGGSNSDRLHGNTGNDYLKGGSGEDTLYGGSDSDRLHGNTGNDYIGGNSGNDKLFGGFGNDIIIGGLGIDDVYGGSGKDIFKVTKGKGYDRIRDFKKGSDKIYIKDFISLRIKDNGSHTKIYNGSKDLLAIIYNEDNIRKIGNYLI